MLHHHSEIGHWWHKYANYSAYRRLISRRRDEVSNPVSNWLKIHSFTMHGLNIIFTPPNEDKFNTSSSRIEEGEQRTRRLEWKLMIMTFDRSGFGELLNSPLIGRGLLGDLKLQGSSHSTFWWLTDPRQGITNTELHFLVEIKTLWRGVLNCYASWKKFYSKISEIV